MLGVVVLGLDSVAEGRGTKLTAVGVTSILPGLHPETLLGVLDKNHTY